MVIVWFTGQEDTWTLKQMNQALLQVSIENSFGCDDTERLSHWDLDRSGNDGNLALWTKYENAHCTCIAIQDYPYPTTFLAPLPANPVTAACVSLAKPYDSDQQLLANVFAGLNVYFNYTGDRCRHSTRITPLKCTFLTSKCLDLGEEDDIGAGMWTYQSCTEMVLRLSDSVFLPPFLLSGDAFLLRRHKWHVRGPSLGHGPVHQGLSTDLGGHP